MKKAVGVCVFCLFIAVVVNRCVAVNESRLAEIDELTAQVLKLEARNAALDAARRALEKTRSENIQRELENVDALEKINSGDLSDNEYFDAVMGLLRKAFQPGPLDAASGNVGRLHGAGSQ